MGTLKTAIDLARIKTRTTNKSSPFSSDNDLVTIVNGILEEIYQTLVSVQSNLVYDEGTITTTSDVGEYTPSFTTKGGFLHEGSWVDGEDTYLSLVSEADKIKWDYDSSTNQPEAFYLTSDGKIGYLWELRVLSSSKYKSIGAYYEVQIDFSGDFSNRRSRLFRLYPQVDVRIEHKYRMFILQAL